MIDCPHAKPSIFDPDRTVCKNPAVHSTRCIHSACPLYNSSSLDPNPPTSTTPYDEPPPLNDFPHIDPATFHDRLNHFVSETQLSLF